MSAAQSVTEPWSNERARALLRHLFSVAVARADPAKILAEHLPEKPTGRCIVVGAGKAAGAMARAVEQAWPDVDLTGVVVVPYGYAAPTARITVREAAHPVPDMASENAARAVMQAVSALSADDLVLALISGGGSSLLAFPADGLTLEDKQITNRVLLASGLDIRSMNAVRKRLSAIKGGKLLAAAAPARVVTLGISDIPGDDPGSIASGPTVPDPDAGLDMAAILKRIGAGLPDRVVASLSAPAQPGVAARETTFRMIATPAMALEAAAAAGRAAGIAPIILGDAIEGEAHAVGLAMAKLARQPVDRPTLYLSGGETTVTIDRAGGGRGGRNTEFLLALATGLGGAQGVWAMAGDTDGEDGANGGAAGAFLDPDTLARGAKLRLDAQASLARHDSGGYFGALGDLLITGPTRTNVNDFRAILVVPGHAPFC